MPQKRKADSELPRPPKLSSTVRRRGLGTYIQAHGDVMPRACSNCRRLGLECRVHIRSGRCGECHLRGGTCDIRISQEEWQRLILERSRLLTELKNAQEAQKEAEEARQAAEDARRLAEEARRRATEAESSAREQLRKVEIEAEEAIAVEEAQILALEREEARKAADPHLALSPLTWSACDGVADDFWDSSISTPWVVSGGEL